MVVSRRTFVLAGAGHVPVIGAALAGLRVWRRDWRAARYRTAAVSLERVDDAIFCMRPAGKAQYHLNATGVMLWQLCERGRSGDELVEALAQSAALPRRRAEHDVQAFLTAVAREGLLTPA